MIFLRLNESYYYSNMLPFLQKHSLPISLLLLLSILAASLYLPDVVPALGMFCLLFAFVTGIAFILEKHKGGESARGEIAKDILIFAITFALIILTSTALSASLGGIVSPTAASYAGAYIEVRWQGMGMLAGFVATILVSFAVGYVVRQGVGKLSGK
jgi:hypothetical protein